MRLTHFQHYRRRSIGAQLADGRIVDLPAAAAAWLAFEQQDPLWEMEVELRLPNDLGKFFAGGKPSLALASEAMRFAQEVTTQAGIGGEPLFANKSEIRLLPPVAPPLILASGARFDADPADQTADVWRHREFFMRDPFNILGPTDPIQLPTWLSNEFDLSARLAVVIGQPLRGASPEEAAEAVFGYCPVIEVCACAQQQISWAGALFHVQYPHARAFDGSLMLGPSVISKDELDFSFSRSTQLFVDGVEIAEHAPPATMGDVIDWICRMSETVTLQPGTLFVPGSADDIAVRRTQSGQLPVELISQTTSASGRLRSGARVTLTLDKALVIETTVQLIAKEDAAFGAKPAFEQSYDGVTRTLGTKRTGYGEDRG
jgi:acylpyruvate hydrolase